MLSSGQRAKERALRKGDVLSFGEMRQSRVEYRLCVGGECRGEGGGQDSWLLFYLIYLRI